MTDNLTGQAVPDEGAATPRELTAAEVCQQHIDAIEASYSLDAVAAVEELRSAVLSLLYLTRNTDNAGRAARTEVDAELARIRERNQVWQSTLDPERFR